MTETMRKFKPPFRGDGFAIVDSEDMVFCGFRPVMSRVDDIDARWDEEETDKRRDIVANALNFYYANQRERSERKGEKE